MTPKELENFLAEYHKFCWAWYEIHPGSPPDLEEYCQLKFGMVQWQKMKREHAEVEMNNLKNKTWTPPAPALVTVRDVYGVDDPKAPEGWEFTGEFRPVKVYESFLTSGGLVVKCCPYSAPDPRLILRPIPKAPDGWKYLRTACPQKDEWFIGISGNPTQARLNFASEYPIIEQLPPEPTLLSVYGTETPKVPAGWKGREFRSVKRGEFYLSAEDHRMDSTRASKDRKAPLSLCQYEARHYFNAEPRLILTPVTEEDVYTLNAHGPIPTGYKRIAFRVPDQGEFYLSPAWNVAVCNYANKPQNPRIILEKRKPEPTIPAGWRKVRSGNPKTGEYYLSAGTVCDIEVAGWDFKDDEKTRVVVEKIPAPTKFSVYGTATPAIPEGWEEVGFRDVIFGDTSLDARGGMASTWNLNRPVEPITRIILRRIPEPTVPDGWRFVRKGLPKKGEWYVFYRTGVPSCATFDYAASNSTTIIERIPTPLDRVRATRVLEYEGPREWVEKTLQQNAVGIFGPGKFALDNDKSIVEKSLKIETI